MKSVFTRFCVLLFLCVASSAQQPELEVKGMKALKVEYGQTIRGAFAKEKNWGGGDLHYLYFTGAAGEIVTFTIEAEQIMPRVVVERIRRGFSGPKILGRNVDDQTKQLYQQFTVQLDEASREFFVTIYRGDKSPHAYKIHLEKVEQLAASVPWSGGTGVAAPAGTAVASSAGVAQPVKRAPEPLVAADYFPKFPVVMNHPDLPQAPKLLAMYEELTKDWKPALTQQMASGALGAGKIKGTFFCEPNATGPAEVKFTPDPKSSSSSQVLLVRVKDASACSQPTTGMIVYGNGVMALANMTLEKGNLLPKTALGPAVFAAANGEANWGDYVAANTMKVAFFTDPMGNTLRRMDEVIPSSTEIARVRLMIPNVGHIDGQTQNMIFQSQSAGTFQSLDGTFKASSELKAYPITAEQLKIAEPISVIFRFTQGQQERPAIALTLEGLTRIDTTQPTELGPPGSYLFFGSLKPGQLPLAEETQPAPGTLAQYSEEAEKCALKPAIPVSWLLWGPDCRKKPDRIQAWSVDGKYRLTFTKLGKPVLEQFNSELPGRSIAEWRAASFSTDNIPQPKGPTELWRNGHLAYRGTFKGLNPDGAGQCGLPGDDTGKTEKCVFANGERVDAIYLARLEQKKVDATFAQREANFEAERLAVAEARAQAAREAAEKRRQLALAQQQQQQQAKAQSRGALFGALLGAGLGMAGGADVNSLTGGSALQSMLSGSSTAGLAGLAGGGLSGDPAQAFLQITDKIMQAKTGTSLTTMQNNPMQAMLELKAKSDREQQAKEAAAAQLAGPSSASNAAYGAPQQQAPPANPQANAAVRNSIALQNGVYGIPENGYQITVTFAPGTLTVVEPNKTSVYKLNPRKPNTYEFTNPNNGIAYGTRVLDSNTLEAFKPLPNGGETAPTRLVQIRALDAPPVAQVSSPATHGPIAPGPAPVLAKEIPCKANSIIWEGEKRYVISLNELQGHSLIGTYQNKDNANGHPIVELRLRNEGTFEMHAANGGGDPLRVTWFVVANCDGTPFVLNKRDAKTWYLLAFQYQEAHRVPVKTGFVEDKKVGQYDLGQLVIDEAERKMSIYGERVKSF